MKHPLYFLSILVLSAISCQKDNSVPADNNSADQIAYFPNEIGYQWIYNLSTDPSDTIKVEIIDQGILPNGDSAKIWTYTYDLTNYTYIDTVWVSHINNDVRFYGQPCDICTDPMPYERKHFIMPLSIGAVWFTPGIGSDTTRVLNQESVVVPAGTFTDVFRIADNMAYVTNSWRNDTIYYKESIGVVRLNQNEYSLGPFPGNGIWELVRYDFGE